MSFSILLTITQATHLLIYSCSSSYSREMAVLKSRIHKNIEELEKLAKTILHELHELEAKDNSINKKERNNDEVPKIDDESKKLNIKFIFRKFCSKIGYTLRQIPASKPENMKSWKPIKKKYAIFKMCETHLNNYTKRNNKNIEELLKLDCKLLQILQGDPNLPQQKQKFQKIKVYELQNLF
jgi:hypothetical protein